MDRYNMSSLLKKPFFQCDVKYLLLVLHRCKVMLKWMLEKIHD